jgi:hypothetical protein
MSDILEIHAVTEYYRCAFRPNDPELTVAEVLDFIEYMQMFYCGEDAIYPFEFTIAEICEGMINRFRARPSTDFDGDTIDREIVCDLILDVREREEVRQRELARLKGAA